LGIDVPQGLRKKDVSGDIKEIACFQGHAIKKNIWRNGVIGKMQLGLLVPLYKFKKLKKEAACSKN